LLTKGLFTFRELFVLALVVAVVAAFPAVLLRVVF
jgi:hypothetical protein